MAQFDRGLCSATNWHHFLSNTFEPGRHYKTTFPAEETAKRELRGGTLVATATASRHQKAPPNLSLLRLISLLLAQILTAQTRRGGKLFGSLLSPHLP